MGRVKLITVLLVGLLIPFLVYAATRTIIATGNWGDTSTWSGGIIPSASDDVDMNNNTTVTVVNGDDYTVVSMVTNNNNTITIDSGGKLTLDNLSGTALLTAGNNIIINVDGTLHIKGNILITNNLMLNVTGTLIVDGDISMDNNASLDIASGGTVTVSGDFVAGNNTTANVDGSMDVSGTMTTGTGSSLTGSGVVTTGGGCSGPPTFCSGAPLPVQIMFFNASTYDNKIKLEWATAREENFSYFTIERSINGEDFIELYEIPGTGSSLIRTDYEVVDEFPLEGTSYYRLRSIDNDGSSEIFDYVSVSLAEQKKDFNIYPNPVINKEFTLQSNFIPTGSMDLVIYNNHGAVEYNLKLNDWHSVISIDDISSGVYYLHLVAEDNVMVKRVIIM